MKNLSELKKYLALPEASMRVMSYEFLMNGTWESIKVDQNYKSIRNVTKDGFELEFEGGCVSFVYFGKSHEWAFDHGSQVIVHLNGGSRVTYKYANIAVVMSKEDEEFLREHFKVIAVS
jgi:hypothetical protein